MYSKEALIKYQKQAREVYSKLLNTDINELSVSISTGNRKIGRVMNVSLLPIYTCTNCKECKHFCYDIKACLQYPKNVLFARCKNTLLARENRKAYFAQIEKKIRNRKKNFFFRWHVAGDILDLDYFENMARIANENKHFIFWTYTKNYNVVNQFCDIYGKEAIPNNLVIMFSEWDGLTLVNPYKFPIFTCKLKAGNKNHETSFFDGLYQCPGNCDLCKEKKLGCIGGMNTYANEH